MALIKRYGIFILLIGLALILLLNKIFLWGFAAMGVGLIIFGIQQLINLNVRVSQFQSRIEGLEDKNKSLAKLNDKLEEEITYLKERQFRITHIKNILELNLYEIDSKFNRSVKNKETISGGREIKYFGCLGVMVKAKYGIDCKELRFKYIPANDELIVANINPKFLSFGNRMLEWDFFEILEYRSQNPLADLRWMTTDDLYNYANKLKEDYRINTEKSLEKGPEELDWIYTPIKQSLENTIRILFRGICRNITILEKADESFQLLEEINFESLPRMLDKQTPEQKGITGSSQIN